MIIFILAGLGACAYFTYKKTEKGKRACYFILVILGEVHTQGSVCGTLTSKAELRNQNRFIFVIYNFFMLILQLANDLSIGRTLGWVQMFAPLFSYTMGLISLYTISYSMLQ
jgi:hypothetical protein